MKDEKALWIDSDHLERKGDLGYLGKKASDLIYLKELSAKAGFEVPKFSVISSSVMKNFLREKSLDDPREVDFFSPLTPPPEKVEQFRNFYRENKSVVMEAFFSVPQDENRPVIRTSITSDEKAWESFVGVNHTTFPAASTDDDYLERGISEAFAGLYKPYSEWYLRRHGYADKERPSALVFTEFVPASAFGAFSLIGDKVKIFIKYPQKGKVKSIDIDLSQTSDKHHDNREVDDLVRVARVLTQEIQSPIEVEFRFDMNGQLYINQMRDVTPVKDQPPPNKELTIYNLLDLPRSLSDLEETMKGIADKENALYVINLEEGKNLDAFSFVFFMQEKYCLKNLNLALVYDENRPITHFLTALEEDPFLQSMRVMDRKEGLQLTSGKKINLGIPSQDSRGARPLGRKAPQ